MKVKAKKDGKTGYVHTGYFTSGSSAAVYQTTATALNLRKSPKVASNNKILVIPKGKKVLILGTSGNWYKVKYAGKTGYVKSGYFTSDTSTSTVKETVNVNLRLRSSAKITDGNIITTIPKGTTVTVLKEVGNNWYYVQYGSRKGYVKGGYFKSDSSSSSSSDDSVSGSKMTTTGNVRMRSSRTTSTDDNIMTVIPRGSKVTMTAAYSGWYKVKYDGMTGYVSSSYVE